MNGDKLAKRIASLTAVQRAQLAALVSILEWIAKSRKGRG